MRGNAAFLRQSGQVVAGEGVAAVLGFAVLAICARTLGPAQFAELALLLAFVAAIELICNFQSARMLIRYGARALDAGETATLASLLRLAVLLDVAGAVIATTVAIVLGVLVLPEGWPADSELIVLFAASMVVNVTGHATALLRLGGRFTFLAAQRVAASTMRLASVGLVIALQLTSLRHVVIAIVVSDASSRLLLLGRGLAEARALGIPRLSRVPLAGLQARYPDMGSFVLYSSLNDVILKVVQQVDIFVVAALLSPVEAGYFRIIKSLGSVPAVVSGAVGQVIYPILARMAGGSREEMGQFLRWLWRRLAAIASVLVAGYWIAADPLVPLLFGGDYLPVVVPSIIYMTGAAMEVLLVPLTPLAMVEGRQRALFVSYAAAAGSYLAVLSAGAGLAGLEGAAAAFPALFLIFGGIMGRLLWAWRKS